MTKLTKNRKKIIALHNANQKYDVEEAIRLVKNGSYTKFDASVDVSVRLGINPKKTDQLIRGTVKLPYGTGRKYIILALCTPDKEKEARDAGADYVGLDEYIEKIEKGWTDVDVIITMPSIMAKVGKLGKVLGPRGLMPNPKTGGVTVEVGHAVKEIKSGRVNFKTDKYGIVSTSVGRVSFEDKKIKENVSELLNTLIKLKPPSAKGEYFKSISITSTMGLGIYIDRNSVDV